MIDSTENNLTRQDQAWNLYVFRKSRETISASDLAADLETEIQGMRTGGSPIDALVRAGEIETGLADAGSDDVFVASQVTDQLAAASLGLPVNIPYAMELLRRISRPRGILCSYSEGFSYYGLSPLDFAELAQRIQQELPPRIAVVGIRSIGSTLGAVVAAALAKDGTAVSRITVRPEGEPYNRKLNLDVSQRSWIRLELEAGAGFLVVDEGPGFSGSTFLSVADGLTGAGVPCARIRLLCSRPVAPRAGPAGQMQELRRFQSHVIRYGGNLPVEADRSIGGGCWRELLYDDRSHWPACWTEMERIKHTSFDGRTLFKFEGLGRFGKLAREQAVLLGEAQFSPRLLGFANGYGRYEFLQGRPLNRSDLSLQLLSQMARYCAFRAENFPAPNTDPAALLAMATVNLGLEFGIDSPVSELSIERPVYADCRMQPHEWILMSSGEILKTDATGHGEGHHLPGPVDIAWDLAGAIVEWELSENESAILLHQYSVFSGDDAGSRVPQYVLLYSVFRMAFCRMAAASMAGNEEVARLRAESKRYTAKTRAALDGCGQHQRIKIS